MSDIMKVIKHLDSIVEHTESDLHKLSKSDEYTPQDLETAKNIAKIAYYDLVLKGMVGAEGEDYSERGYSERGYSRHYPTHPYASYERGNSMGMSENGGSYARYGGNIRGNSYGGSAYRGYSREESRNIVMRKLEEAMNNAESERERIAIEECMSKM